MIQKSAAALAVLALVALSSPLSGQTSPAARPASPAPIPRQVPPPTAGTPSSINPPSPQSELPGAPPPAGAPSSGNDCFGGNCNLPTPRISIATPAPAPAPWPWQERIAWGANIVLVILGYVGIMLALSLLRKIEKQTHYIEESVQKAGESARAAILLAEGLQRAERPWIVMDVRPARDVEDGFTVTATNRGRGPARVLSIVDEIVCAVDEKHLPPTPTYTTDPAEPTDAMVLLPGETAELTSFSRSDVQQVCGTAERLKRVEEWQEKIFLYGRVEYRDLAAAEDAPLLESSWMCWYIHGRQKSGMVMAGPPVYNKHT